MKTIYKFLSIIGLFAIFASCSSDAEFQKSPVDDMIKEMTAEQDFTIILHDMDVEEGTFSDKYKHQYQVITVKDSTPAEKVTEWYYVSEEFFMTHQNDMGMEIASKKDGAVSKDVAPPGFSNYVGNPSYGQWSTNSSGDSFWEFYGKFAMMSTMFNLMTYPAYNRTYGDYRSNYRGSGRPYYGSSMPDGRAQYGTNSGHAAATRSNSSWFSKASNQNFRDKVQNKTSRSGSRYSTKSSSRSRGGGSGK